MDLDLLVVELGWGIDGHVLEVHLFLANGDIDGSPRLNLLSNVGLVQFCFFKGLALALDYGLPLDDDGLLQRKFLLWCGCGGSAFLEDLNLLQFLLFLTELRLQELSLGFEAGHSLFYNPFK